MTDMLINKTTTIIYTTSSVQFQKSALTKLVAVAESIDKASCLEVCINEVWLNCQHPVTTDYEDRIHKQNVICKLCNGSVLESVIHNKMLKALRNLYFNFHSALLSSYIVSFQSAFILF